MTRAMTKQISNRIQSQSKSFGWLIIGFLIACVSTPPLPGHTTLTTLCGYAWGVPDGFYIAAPASVLGSALVFTVLRLGFQKRLQRFSKGNEKWRALEAVIAAKGLPLIILIRMSAFPPWAYSNVFFASIGSVGLWQFIMATFFVFPKIFLQVYIGSRLAALSDGEQRGAMDTRTKIINGLFIGGGIAIAVFASGLVYKLVQKQIRTLSGIPPEIDELAAEAIEDSEEAPLLTSNTRV